MMPEEQKALEDQLLREALPAWAKDGKGIRGDAPVVLSSSVNMDWPRAKIERHAETGQGGASQPLQPVGSFVEVEVTGNFNGQPGRGIAFFKSTPETL